MTEETNNKPKKKRNWPLLLWRLFKRTIQVFLGLTIKTLTFFCLFVLVLVAAGWFLFVKYFNAQNIAQNLADEMRRTLGRPVALGSVELRFFNYAKINNLVIFDTESETAEPLLEAASVMMRYDPFPLMRNHLHIEQITFEKPRIFLYKNPDGTLNMPQIRLPSLNPVPKTGARQSRPFTVHISDWEITGGTFIFANALKQTSYSVYDVNAKFKDLDFGSPSPFTASFVSRNSWKDKIAEITVKANGRINLADFNWQKFNLRNTSVSLDFFKKPIKINFDFDNIMMPFFTFTASVPALNDDDLSLFIDKKLNINFPQSKISGSTVLKNSYRHFTVSKLNVSAGDIKLNGQGSLSFEKKIPAADFSFKTEPFELAGKEKVYSKIKKYNLGGSAAVTSKMSFADGKLKVPSLEIALKNARGKAGTLNGGFNISGVDGAVYAKDDFSALGAKVTNGALKLGKQVFTEVKGTCDYKKNTLNGFVTSAKINDVPMKISADITDFNNDKKREITAKLYMNNFDVMPFYDVIYDFVLAIAKPSKAAPRAADNSGLAWLHIFKDGVPKFMPNFKGFIAADNFNSPVLSGKNFYAEFNLTGLLPGIKTLDGVIDAQLENGVIYQLEKKAAEEKVLGIAFQPFLLMHRMEKAGSFKVGQVLKDVNYKKILLSSDFKNGKMEITNVYSDGNTLGVAAKGNVDWAGEKLDATVWTIFRNTSRSGALAENLTDASGAPALAFKVREKMEAPKVEILKPRTSGEEINKAIKRGIRTNFADAINFKPAGETDAQKQ